MKRSVDLRFGEFARAALEEQAHLHRDSIDEAVRIAALYHLSELHTGRMALRVPRLGGPAEAEAELAVELDLEGPAWAALQEVAVRQRTALERLIEHAVWCYLADWDSGVVAARILERAEAPAG